MIHRDERQAHSRVGRTNWRSLTLQAIVYGSLLGLALFSAAGRLDWIAGWAFLLGYLAFVAVLVIRAMRRDPELIEERRHPGPGVKRWDRLILTGHTACLLATLVVSALDAGRFRWTHPPAIVRGAGWMGLVGATTLVWWAMAANRFLSSMVRIQSERGHQVVTAGPYRMVRHPMYLGIILADLGLPLALGSWWALVPGALGAMLILLRTALEDRTLQAELPGYAEYAGQVRFRLVPGIW
ncbi:MAG: isoprenylcysteine carboxylmethyltransferase family protein [Anaerolineae bacterium]|nr:isoprenylcysteine carboxylmethyltransferase family protein [Anaerolineae bacterium]